MDRGDDTPGAFRCSGMTTAWNRDIEEAVRVSQLTAFSQSFPKAVAAAGLDGLRRVIAGAASERVFRLDLQNAPSTC